MLLSSSPNCSVPSEKLLINMLSVINLSNSTGGFVVNLSWEWLARRRVGNAMLHVPIFGVLPNCIRTEFGLATSIYSFELSSIISAFTTGFSRSFCGAKHSEYISLYQWSCISHTHWIFFLYFLYIPFLKKKISIRWSFDLSQLKTMTKENEIT